MSRPTMWLGLELRSDRGSSSVREALADARAGGFDFGVVALRSEEAGWAGSASSLLRPASDLELASSEWTKAVVGAASGATSTMGDELEWASHLNLSSTLVEARFLATPEAARVVCAALNAARRVHPWQLWVTCRLDEWPTWHRLRTLCDQSPALVVALVLEGDVTGATAEVRRWRAEPVKAVVVPVSAFRKNEAGYPVLPRATQSLLASLAALMDPHVRILVRGGDGLERYDEAEPALYARYLRHLGDTSLCPLPTERQAAERPYRDFLQSPLQPLADHLESATYEVFEQDPVKYAQYQEAIRRYLDDGAIFSRNEQAQILVVGAGRGPLVQAALEAADAVGRRVSVVALEKNPHALRTLRARAAGEWHRDGLARVEVVAGDARLPELTARHRLKGRFDCVVSELLGSFGDNELSPECLAPVTGWLRLGGVSIPYAYTSFAQPIAAAKLWFEARRAAAPGAPPGPPPALVSPGAPPPARGLETPFVVKLHAFTPLAHTKPCLSFNHPDASSPAAPGAYDRHVRLEFPPPDLDTVAHGLAGYFEATLYADVAISIHPPTFSEGMFSWFPLFFPFAVPVPLRGSVDSLAVHLWRCSDSTRVWYEWAVVEPLLLPIQNPNGRSFAMLL